MCQRQEHKFTNQPFDEALELSADADLSVADSVQVGYHVAQGHTSAVQAGLGAVVVVVMRMIVIRILIDWRRAP
jgi:hypothetical protein